jgi:DNA-directed RNA polymerase specialized sigma24 family protein
MTATTDKTDKTQATERAVVRAIDMGYEPATGWAEAVTHRSADPVALPVAALFREHHGDLVRLALLMVGDLGTAEDVVQDVYARLHTRWNHIAAQDAVLPDVRAAVLNGCRSALRRRGIARRAGILQNAGVLLETASAEHEVMVSEDRRQVLAALARLPREPVLDRQRAVARLSRPVV